MINSEEKPLIRTSEAAQKIIRSDCVVQLENIDHITGLLTENRSVRVSELKPKKIMQNKKKVMLKKGRILKAKCKLKSPPSALKLKIAKQMRSRIKAKGISPKYQTNRKSERVSKIMSESNKEMIVFNDKYINNEKLNCTEGFLTNTEGVVEVDIQDIMHKNLEGVKAKPENFKVVPFIESTVTDESDKVDGELEAKKKREAVMDSVEETISKIFGLDSKNSDDETSKDIKNKGKKRKVEVAKEESVSDSNIVKKKETTNAKSSKVKRGNEFIWLTNSQHRGLRSSLRRDVIGHTRRNKGKLNYRELAGIVSTPKKVDSGKPKAVTNTKVTDKKVTEEKSSIKTKLAKTVIKTEGKAKALKKENLSKAESTPDTPASLKHQVQKHYKLVVPKSFDINDLEFRNNQLVYSPKSRKKRILESDENTTTASSESNFNKVGSLSEISKENKPVTRSGGQKNKPTGATNKSKTIPTLNKQTQSAMTPLKNPMKYSWKDKNTLETWRKRKFKLTTVVKVWEIKPDPLFGVKNNTSVKQEVKVNSNHTKDDVKNHFSPQPSKFSPPDLRKMNAAIPKDLSYIDFVKKYEENKQLYKKLSETYKNENTKVPKTEGKLSKENNVPLKGRIWPKKYPTTPKSLNSQINQAYKAKNNSVVTKSELKDLEDELECNIIMSEPKRTEEEEEDEEELEDSSNMDDSDHSEMDEDYEMDEDDDSELEYLCRLSLPHSAEPDTNINNENCKPKITAKKEVTCTKKDDFTEDKIVIFQDMLDQVQKVRLPKSWEVRCTEFGITFLTSDRFVTVSANLDINIKIDNKSVELMGAPRNVSCIEDLSIVLDIISTIEKDDFMLVYN